MAVKRYNGTAWEVKAGDQNITYAATAPTAPSIGDVWVSTQDIVSFDNTVQTGNRNAIINGGMDIWQRGTTSSASGYQFIVDRWTHLRAGSASGITVARFSSGLSGFQYCTRVQRDSGNTSTAALYFAQSFESASSLPYAGKTVTLSFYARSGANYSAASSTLRATIEYQASSESNYFYIGDGSGTVLAATTNASLTTNWTRYTATATLPSNATQIFTAFKFTPVGTAGANDYFEITGVQLEAGSTATPFEYRPIGQELSLCQRYYEQSFNISQAPANGIYTNYYMTFVPYNDTWVHAVPFIPFRVEKRAIPTITFYGDAGRWQRYNPDGTHTTLAVVGTSPLQAASPINTTGFGVGCHNNGGSGFGVGAVVGVRGDWVASAEL